MTPLSLFLAVTNTPPLPAEPRTTEPRTAESRLELPTLGASIVSTSAFGVSHGKFFNQLLGARVEGRFGERFSFGATFSYANLKGKDERVHNVLPEATAAYRLPLTREALGLPVRWSLGFLPKNGPTLRLGAGLDIALADDVALALVPAEVMVWLTRERPEVSLDASFGLCVSF